MIRLEGHEVAPHIGEAVADVLVERIRQDGIWGVQNHPAGTGYEVAIPLGGARTSSGWPPYRLEVVDGQVTVFTDARFLADMFRARCKQRTSEGAVTWADILLEEVFELLAETGPVEVYTEAIQVSAVAAAMAQSVDRNSPLMCQVDREVWPCKHVSEDLHAYDGHAPVRPSRVVPEPKCDTCQDNGCGECR